MPWLLDETGFKQAASALYIDSERAAPTRFLASAEDDAADDEPERLAAWNLDDIA